MNNDDKILPIRRGLGDGGSVERRLMNEALARLGPVDLNIGAGRAGRLIFGLDLTGSRAQSLKRARIATAAMFDTIKTMGKLAVKLIYFRGANELRASAWHDDPAVLSESMRQLSCRTGETQIARLLRAVLAETERISGVVFVGDHCEDDPGEVVALAESLGKRSMPLFLFHEIADHDGRSLEARPVFERMAEVSGGVYVEFRPDSGAVLHEMLANVAALAAAGLEGVKQVALIKTPEARQLQTRLLLAAPEWSKGGLLGPGRKEV